MSIPVHCAHTEMASVSDLTEHPLNPNEHPPRQIELLAKIVKANGWRGSIVVSNLSGHIIAGRGRHLAGEFLEEEFVPIDRQDFASEAEEIRHLRADNAIAEYSEIVQEKDQKLIDELQALGEEDLEFAGYSAEDFEGEEEPEEEDFEPEPEPQLFGAVILCNGKGAQTKLIKKLTAEGYSAEPVKQKHAE